MSEGRDALLAKADHNLTEASDWLTSHNIESSNEWRLVCGAQATAHATLAQALIARADATPDVIVATPEPGSVRFTVLDDEQDET